MKRTILICALLSPFLMLAQPRLKDKKYPSLLWEISGNGMAKKSYLFGTMHVSSKLAFHLADSFYIGIRKADVVALETNPESWQEDMSKYDLGSGLYGTGYYGYGSALADEYFLRGSLRFSPYIPAVESALYTNPSSINNLLYRSYGNQASDFEEDTYLDMYIYQCGKKWGKKVAGVERYEESMRLMAEAYRDASRDPNRKQMLYGGDDNEFSQSKLQDAYRSGNLDWLDSINKRNSMSDAFDEKFMYRRNEIQAGNIDSILKTGQSLFVGVGAAHLPGQRGVIEMLRLMGYKMRPVKMGARDSDHKAQVEKLRVPVVFQTQRSDDGFYQVDIPGKFYASEEEPSNKQQQQYADMANGSYYMVSRVETNGWMWGHSMLRVQAVIDSLLYENIPGRIIKKTAISRNGYPGIDIVNRTRRGDVQRYNIFITPFEMLLFKMSGTGDYVTQGPEADRFFSSVKLRTVDSSGFQSGWKPFSPATGGFQVNFPHEPFAASHNRWIYDASDPKLDIQLRVIRNDIHNYQFAGEDSFDLAMMEESFGSSDFIDKKISSSYGITGGYPSLDVSYRDKNGGLYQVRFLVRGPHYYTVLAHGATHHPRMDEFLNSFRIQPFVYGPASPEKDTTLAFTVVTPYINRPDKEKIDLAGFNFYGTEEDDPGGGSVNHTRIIRHDSTGEMITVSYYRMSEYQVMKDSLVLKDFNRKTWNIDSARIIRSSVSGDLPNDGKFFELELSDSASSQMIRMKLFFINGNGFALYTQGDTLSAPSDFVRSFFETFRPADSLKSLDPFAGKTSRFFREFLGADTIARKRAIKGLDFVTFSEPELDSLNLVIRSLDYREKNYLDLKKQLIGKMGNIKTKKSTDLLRSMYQATADTLDLQYEVLETLLEQETDYSFKIFRDIILADPPVIGGAGPATGSGPGYFTADSYNESFFSGLYDSLQLTAGIMPQLMPLMNIGDYEPQLMPLLARLADSSLIKPKLYQSWYNKFLLQARQKLKKKIIAQKQQQIATAELNKDEEARLMMEQYGDLYGNSNQGSDELETYLSLLLPFYDKKEAVRSFVAQVLSTPDDPLRFQALFQVLHHKKPVPDSLLLHFAKSDEYRYQLYARLRDRNRLELFPSAFKTQQLLGRSYILQGSASRPDSLVYLGKLEAKIKQQQGQVLFYKLGPKKGNGNWRLVSVGLLPTDSTLMEFPGMEDSYGKLSDQAVAKSNYVTSKYDIIEPSASHLDPDQPLEEQLRFELKRILFSLQKSGKMFSLAKNPETEFSELSLPD